MECVTQCWCALHAQVDSLPLFGAQSSAAYFCVLTPTFIEALGVGLGAHYYTLARTNMALPDSAQPEAVWGSLLEALPHLTTLVLSSERLETVLMSSVAPSWPGWDVQ